jgi:uncharacterized protein YukE
MEYRAKYGAHLLLVIADIFRDASPTNGWLAQPGHLKPQWDAGLDAPGGSADRPLLVVAHHRFEYPMPQAIVDPIELRRFAQNLKKFNQELEERLTSLRAQLHSLGATWRDQEHKKFVEDFDEHMKVIAKYIEATNQHAPYLLRKAERIEEYLQQR